MANRDNEFRARVNGITRGLTSELGSMGIEASPAAFPGEVTLRGRHLDGLVVHFKANSLRLDAGEYEVGVLYYVLPPGEESLDEDWVQLERSVRITRRRAFPFFGRPNGLRFSARVEAFRELGIRLRLGEVLGQLLMTTGGWRSIDIIPVMVGERTWPPGALAIQGQDTAAPTPAVFDCYEHVARHLHETLRSLCSASS